MSTIHATAKTRNLFHEPVAAPDPADSLTIARGAGVTEAVSLLANCERIRTHFLVVAGEELSWALAIHCLDVILAENRHAANRPFPAELAPIACWLERFDYTSMAIHSILNYIAANGTVDLCPICDSEDKAYVEHMIPASVRIKATGRRIDTYV